MRAIGLNFGHDAGAARVGPDGALVIEVEKEIGIRHACAGGTEEARETLRRWTADWAGSSRVGVSDYSFVKAPVTPAGLDTLIADPTWAAPERIADAVVRRIDPGPWFLADAVGDAEVYAVRHHFAHAASAYYSSEADDALVLALDGAGNYAECGMVCIGAGDRLTPVMSLHNETGPRVGLVYEALAKRVFRTNFDTGKLLGLSAVGTVDHELAEPLAVLLADNAARRAMPDLLAPLSDERLAGTAMRYGDTWYPYDTEAGGYITAQVRAGEDAVNWFGRRFPDSVRMGDRVVVVGDDAEDPATQHVAATLQHVVEETLVHLVTGLSVRYPGHAALCYAGGCALNITANTRLAGLYPRMHIPTCCDDSGIALGAALAVAGGLRASATFAGPALSAPGPAAQPAGTSARGGLPASGTSRFADDEDMVETVADWLADGLVIGWVQGPLETGPRALGHRSLLASPHIPGMRRRVSQELKGREWFRPVAPLCPADVADQYFTGPLNHARTMLFACTVVESRATELAEVRHVDGSARLQVVDREENPLLHALLHAVGSRTGLPVLINTSLNPGGRPIVNTASDARDLLSAARNTALVLADTRTAVRPTSTRERATART
ncbi:carbamoyltransferase C-terminal domain-containing protein [Streptomyces sp. AA0539]|uniref:carbamoyltransferase C-terminal domain-containing protein n=1 Tax=Streptomyces sp. AA0539 TaxID=1210045 RepID=UPI00031B5A95|nr:carbamoyltransferase C-terminal domain-containing protein [Streptomyces sp. AA0539]